MTNSIYNTISRQASLLKELSSVSNNIANSNTIGFRAERPFYSEYVRMLGENREANAQTRIAGRMLNSRIGALIKTGGPFDVALEGEGYFSVDTAQGPMLTRAGAFALDSTGSITTAAGARALDESGAPIVIPPETNEIVITPDGSITADGALVGRFAVVSAPVTALERFGDALYRSREPVIPIRSPMVRQGYLENSNVNAVHEIARLVEVQRAYEFNQQLTVNEDERIRKAIEAFSAR